jgi:hypothetical protein
MIINASIDVTKIEKAKLKNGKYLNLTAFVNDELDQYGNNVAIIVSQSKEERQVKTPRVYLGNGKTNTINTPAEEVGLDDLAF